MDSNMQKLIELVREMMTQSDLVIASADISPEAAAAYDDAYADVDAMITILEQAGLASRPATNAGSRFR